MADESEQTETSDQGILVVTTDTLLFCFVLFYLWFVLFTHFVLRIIFMC